MSSRLTDAPSSTQFSALAQRLRALRNLLASMRFAIALLTVICIVSIVGTVLRQHEPMGNYINQFGPFWARVFLALDLNTIYSAWWFLLILAFLVISTTLCLMRHTPKYLADLRNFQENIRVQSLRAFGHRAQATLAQPAHEAASALGKALAGRGWKVRVQQRTQGDGATGFMIAAKAGAAHKLGYIASHAAIVLICLGGLLDGDLIMRTQIWFGGKTPYESGPLQPQHILSASNPTYRGSVKVDEGAREQMAVLVQSDGLLLQPLPFALELKRFSIDYYDTGMPRLFSSEVVIHDLDTGQTHERTVEVNHPVSHRGVEIYQSGFDDGGSPVTLRALPLLPATGVPNAPGSGGRVAADAPAGVAVKADGQAPVLVQGRVGQTLELPSGLGGQTLELTELRTINVEDFSVVARNQAAQQQEGSSAKRFFASRMGAGHRTQTEKQLRNIGPSIGYKLRDDAGQAREYRNYMAPVDFGDGPMFLLGMRASLADEFRYLRVPADADNSPMGFMRLHAALHDAALRERAVENYVRTALSTNRRDLQEGLHQSALQVLTLFAGTAPQAGRAAAAMPDGGLQAISRFLETSVPQAEQAAIGDVLLGILTGVLYELAKLAQAQVGLPPLPMNEATTTFMTQAVFALSDVQFYPAPFVFMLDDFTKVDASVFQVARAPGKNVVYLGCLLLVVGVFAMLYVRDRRLWIWLSPGVDAASTQAQMALSCNRRLMDVDREFAQLSHSLLGVAPEVTRRRQPATAATTPPSGDTPPTVQPPPR